MDGDYSGDAPGAPSSGSLLQLIDVANAHAWELWSDADEGWNSVRVPLMASAGTASFVDLPSDCHRIRSVEARCGQYGGWEALGRANSSDDRPSFGGAGGSPSAYREWPTQLELLPCGSSAEVRLTYCPVAQDVDANEDIIPGTDGYDQVVTYLTLAAVREGEEKDTSEYLSRAAFYEDRFREAIRRRDRSSPMRMRPRGGAMRGRRR